MADTKKTNPNAKEASGNRDFKFCCGDVENMPRMMRKFCWGEGGKFDCETMMQKMQKMCCVPTEKSGQ